MGGRFGLEGGGSIRSPAPRLRISTSLTPSPVQRACYVPQPPAQVLFGSGLCTRAVLVPHEGVGGCCVIRAVLKGPDFFLLRTAPRDHQPPTANSHQPPTATSRQPPTANRQLTPTADRHQPPTAANRHQPPITNCQLPPTAANRCQPPTARGGRLLGPGTRLPPPPPLWALRAHLVTKGQWLLAIHRVAPKAPENFGDPRECRGCAKGAHLGQSLNPRFVAWCIMVTPGIGFDFRFCSLCWGPPRMQG